MAKLFKKNIVKEKIQGYEITNLEEKIQVLKNWYNLHTNGTLKNKKEEELEGPFGADFFGKILDYNSITEDEAYNRKFQPKVPEGGQKADIGLGFFGESKEIMKVVVELKDAKTSLDKPQQRAGNLTPIQQAFKYKPYFKDCDFIIVSNFYETRLYIDSYYDYESWTLEDLINPNDNYFNFKRFYYLLNKQNLITKSGESNTKSLLSLIRIQEKEITKKFYKEYTILRKELFKDIVANNPGFKKTELDFLLNKTQKIIDRIIFIHFCEDLDLLPNGKLKEVIDFGAKSLATTWQTLCNFFNAVDKGSDKLGIPDGYNGGLFKEDEELNNLKVGDEICKKFVDLGEYDFADELSVNILGHIFEQSISDIEELKDKINRQEEATLSKRKKDGVFYTPEYIVDYIVKNSVGKKIDEWEEELKEKHHLKEDITDKNYKKRAILVYEELQTRLHSIKVLDPACGSGAFLVKVFDFLLDKNKEISKKLEDLSGNNTINLFQTETHFKNILQNNIYGVDLNEESVEITKLSLWLKTAQKGKKLANLDSNIKCGNSLIDDKEIAGDKAFVWETEFKDIFDNGGFDVIVGNPPYVRSRGVFSEEEKNYFLNKYTICSYQLDLYKLFLEKGVYLLKKEGYLSFINPSVFLINDYDIIIRKFFLEGFNINEIVNSKKDIFEDATVKTCIFTIKNIKPSKNTEIKFSKIEDEVIFEDKRIKQSIFCEDKYLINENLSITAIPIINKIKENSVIIGDYFEIKNGIKVRKELLFDNKIDKNYKEFLLGRNMSRYGIDFDNLFIHYLPENEKLYTNQAFRKPEIFEREKILVRQILGNSIYATFDNNNFYVDQKIYIIYSNNNLKEKYLLPILSSKLMYFFYQNIFGDNKIVFPQIKRSQMLELPIKNISISEQKPFIEKADFMLDKNKELQEKVNKFIKRLNSSFEIDKLSKKIEAFYDLEFSEFVKELKKKKAELSLKDQDEWEEYFDIYKKEVLELKTQIDTCDEEIDDMVFDLYDLSEDEKEVVLGSK